MNRQMPPETKVLTAHVPLPLAKKVDQMAARLERSRGWIMKQALMCPLQCLLRNTASNTDWFLL